MLKYIHSYLNYEIIFGYKKDFLELKTLINRVDNKVFLPYISQLSSLPDGANSKVYKEDLLKYIRINITDPSFISKVTKLLNENSLYSTQGMLNVWKYTLFYGNGKFDIESEVDASRNYIDAFLICLCVSDYLYKEESNRSIIYEIFQNYVFNTSADFSVSLARTLIIFTQIARDKSRFEHVDGVFFDIDKEFFNKYSFSLEDYIYCLFGLYCLFVTKKNHQLTNDWYQSITQAFKNTIFLEIAKKIIEPLTFTLEVAKKDLLSTMHNHWDFSFFMKKPLFNPFEDTIMPVNLQLFENSLTEGLYWKVRDCYPKTSTTFQSFFGRPFEFYVQDLVNEASSKSPLPYKVIPEVKYGKSNKKSPDVMVRLGNKLLVIEVKSKRLRYTDSIVEGSEVSIEEDRIIMTVKPMEQMNNRLNELMDGECPEIDISEIKEIFCIVVNQGMFPTLTPIEKKIVDDWSLLPKIADCKTFLFHFSIEELEYLVSLLEKNKPIFGILKRKLLYPNYSFKTFIYDKKFVMKMPERLYSLYKNLPNIASRHLGL